MFIYIKKDFINIKTFFIKHIFYLQKNYVDNYNIIYYSLNGILIWLNILHINIILIKHSFIILLNNIEYLII